MKSAFERFRDGNITRDEYLTETGLKDVTLDRQIVHMLELLQNCQFRRIINYVKTLETESSYMKEDIIDFCYDCLSFTKEERFFHPDYREVKQILEAVIKDIRPPVPLLGR